MHAEENALAALFGQRTHLLSLVVRVQMQCDELSRRMYESEVGGAPAAQLQFVESQRIALRRAAAEIQSTIEDLNRAISLQQEKYMSARRESEKLERLRATELAAWHKQLERRDQAAVDELFLMRLGARSKR
ncbi:flagellar export protein FliJ [Candidatus Korobacter versatilis]|nr:flagellar export protein FliJ [Candidatus Koribacter versatilis]